MTHNWQFWIVICCVLFAGWRMGLRIWRSTRVKQAGGSCGGGCNGCVSSPAVNEAPLVQLDLKHSTHS